MKALGAGIGAFAFRDVEVVRARGRARPGRRSTGAGAADLAAGRGVSRWHVSLTHTARLAVAMVVAEGDRWCRRPVAGRVASAMQPVSPSPRCAPPTRRRAGSSQSTPGRRAGTAVALGRPAAAGSGYGRRVVVVAGQGNNGADGRVAGRRPAPARGAGSTVVDAGRPRPPSTAATWWSTPPTAPASGAATRRPAVPTGPPVLAVDIPSGVDGDTGEARGRPMAADRTVTFAALKPGLLQGDGAGLAGEVEVADIGLPRRGDRHRPGRGRRRRGAGAPRAARRATSGPARWRWWPARRGWRGRRRWPPAAASRAGAGMVRLAVPGRPRRRPGLWPWRRCACPCPPRGGPTRCWAASTGAGRWWSARGSGARRGHGGRGPRAGGRSPVPVVVDADALYALGAVGGRRWSSGAAGGAHPPRRRVRPPGRGAPGPTGWPRPAGWPARPGRWCC